MNFQRKENSKVTDSFEKLGSKSSEQKWEFRVGTPHNGGGE